MVPHSSFCHSNNTRNCRIGCPFRCQHLDRHDFLRAQTTPSQGSHLLPVENRLGGSHSLRIRLGWQDRKSRVP
ncbi:hypothetical protein NY78_2957 [Desulfovibrio sp. TomC]|nr:hypothetical protein NY78_2957 [Desulfovibrio sp. TomC]